MECTSCGYETKPENVKSESNPLGYHKCPICDVEYDL